MTMDRLDEVSEEGMRAERFGPEFRVKLDRDKPGVSRELEHFDEFSVRRMA